MSRWYVATVVVEVTSVSLDSTDSISKMLRQGAYMTSEVTERRTEFLEVTSKKRRRVVIPRFLPGKEGRCFIQADIEL